MLSFSSKGLFQHPGDRFYDSQKQSISLLYISNCYEVPPVQSQVLLHLVPNEASLANCFPKQTCFYPAGTVKQTHLHLCWTQLLVHVTEARQSKMCFLKAFWYITIRCTLAHKCCLVEIRCILANKCCLVGGAWFFFAVAVQERSFRTEMKNTNNTERLLT